jgi:hypothetical protein
MKERDLFQIFTIFQRIPNERQGDLTYNRENTFKYKKEE